jgi:tRNA pseudouridine13 synthase
MFGTRMVRASGAAQAREEAVLAEAGLTLASFAKARDLGEGTRRPVRVLLDDLAVERDGDAVRLSFTLPPGAYATALAREMMKGAETVETALE